MMFVKRSAECVIALMATSIQTNTFLNAQMQPDYDSLERLMKSAVSQTTLRQLYNSLPLIIFKAPRKWF